MTSARSRYDIFVSYSRRNTPFVRKLHERLVAADREVWVDWEDIPFTADWWSEIQRGIEEADSFVFVISEASMRSTVCMLEVAHAIQHRKRLIPLLHENPNIDTIHQEMDTRELDDVAQRMVGDRQLGALSRQNWTSIARHNWLMFGDDSDFETSFRQLLDTLDLDLIHVRQHTRLVVRASEWQLNQRSTSFMLYGDDLARAEQWLAGAAEKDPAPTMLQAEYIYHSRRNTNRIQRRIQVALAAAALTMLILALFALFESARATQEANQRATQEAIAIANAADADSRRLAVLALQAIDDNALDRAMLLALEALRRQPTHEARSSLLAALVASPRLERFVYDAAEPLTTALVVNDWLITGDEAGTLTLRDHVQLSIIDTIPAHQGRIWDVVVSPNGSQIASAGEDGTIRLWTLTNMTLIPDAVFTLGSPVRGVAFHPDGERLLAGGETDDGAITVWHLSDPAAPQAVMTAHDDWLWDLQISPDGSRLASTSDDTTVRLWTIESDGSLSPSAVLTGHSNWVVSAAFSPDSARLASADVNGDLLLWDLSADDPSADPRRLRGHTERVWSLHFVEPLKLISTSADSTVRLWDLTTLQSEILRGHTDDVRDGANTRSGWVSVSRDRHLIRWDLSGEALLAHTADQAEGRVYDLLHMDDSGALIEARDDAVAAVQIGDQVALGMSNGKVHLRNPMTGEDQRLPAEHQGAVFAVDFNGTLLASGGDDRQARLWNPVDWSQVRTLPHSDTVNALAFSPDGAWLVTGARDGQLTVWDTATGEPLTRLAGHSGGVETVAFNHSGTLLVTGSRDTTLIIWDLRESGSITPLKTLVDHTDWVLDAVFSADDRLLAAGSRSGEVILWEIDPDSPRFAEAVGVPLPHNTWVWSVDFAPDGQSVLAGLNNGRVVRWSIDVDVWTENACRIANRSLSTEEWQRFLGALEYRETCPQG